jgi:hypothetical protein
MSRQSGRLLPRKYTVAESPGGTKCKEGAGRARFNLKIIFRVESCPQADSDSTESSFSRSARGFLSCDGSRVQTKDCMLAAAEGWTCAKSVEVSSFDLLKHSTILTTSAKFSNADSGRAKQPSRWPFSILSCLWP